MKDQMVKRKITGSLVKQKHFQVHSFGAWNTLKPTGRVNAGVDVGHIYILL